MAISVNPASLTGPNLANQRAALAKRQTALQANARNRGAVQALLNKAIKKGYNPALIAKLRGRLQTATSQTAASQKTYQSQLTGTYRPFETAYKRLGALGDQNSTLDSVLSKLTPFDPESAGERLQAQSGLNQSLLQGKQQRDELAGDYAQGQRQLQEGQGERNRSLLSNFAGRGLARSSGYASAYGDEQADYTRRQTDLDTQNQRGQAQLSLADAGAQADYQSQLAAILAGTTGRLAADAGGLGMAGQPDLPLLLELARRRLAAGGS